MVQPIAIIREAEHVHIEGKLRQAAGLRQVPNRPGAPVPKGLMHNFCISLRPGSVLCYMYIHEQVSALYLQVTIIILPDKIAI